MRFLGTFLLSGAAAIAMLAACSSSSSSSSDSVCASDPFSCGSGQTCSVKTTLGDFACLPSGTGQKGAACQNTAGVAPCGDGLVCFQTSAAGGGKCTAFCDATHTCDTGETCQTAILSNTTQKSEFHVCYAGTAPPPPPPVVADGGSDAASD